MLHYLQDNLQDGIQARLQISIKPPILLLQTKDPIIIMGLILMLPIIESLVTMEQHCLAQVIMVIMAIQSVA